MASGWSDMKRLAAFLGALAVATTGCSIIVDGQLNKADAGGSDGGDTGEVCQTTAQCLTFDGQQVNCRRICRVQPGMTDGRCVQLAAPMATPDGISCGASGPPMEICVTGSCVERRCGDRFRDRLPGTSMPEFCDDGANGNPNDGCNDSCTRPCGPGIPTCDNGDPCDGVETCVASFCATAAGQADGMSCTTTAVPSGMCRSQRCVAP
jgi:hypothetical protein